MTMTVNSLFQAIKAKYDSTAGATLRGLTPGGLWPYEAPQGTTGTYVIWSLPTQTALYTMSRTTEVCDVQLSVFTEDASPLSCIQAGNALAAVFDDVLLLVSGYQTVIAERKGCNLVKDPDKGWQYAVQYEYRIEEA